MTQTVCLHCLDHVGLYHVSQYVYIPCALRTPTNQRLSACPLCQEMDQSVMTTTMPSAIINYNVRDASAQQLVTVSLSRCDKVYSQTQSTPRYLPVLALAAFLNLSEEYAYSLKHRPIASGAIFP